MIRSFFLFLLSESQKYIPFDIEEKKSESQKSIPFDIKANHVFHPVVIDNSAEANTSSLTILPASKRAKENRKSSNSNTSSPASKTMLMSLEYCMHLRIRAIFF